MDDVQDRFAHLANEAQHWATMNVFIWADVILHTPQMEYSMRRSGIMPWQPRRDLPLVPSSEGGFGLIEEWYGRELPGEYLVKYTYG